MCVVQLFESGLGGEQLAQAQYYSQCSAGDRDTVWSDILHPPDNLDNVSLQSCPLDNLSSFSPHHQRTQSACLPVRPPRSHRPLSHQPPPASPLTSAPRPVSTPPPYSFSSSYLSSSRYSLTSSQQSLVPQSPPMPRPRSLYVPFVGCVDAPRAPPGRAARDILHAMSYAPTSSDSPHDNHPPSQVFKSPALRSKSSSLASLLTPRLARRQETETALFSSTSSLLHSPTFSPSHPVNNCENSCLKVSHPPVLHPPPDLVQMTGSSSLTSSTYSPQPSSRSSQSPLMFDFQNPSLLTQSSLTMIREASPYQ